MLCSVEELFSLGPDELGYLTDKDNPDAKVWLGLWDILHVNVILVELIDRREGESQDIETESKLSDSSTGEQTCNTINKFKEVHSPWTCSDSTN